MATAPPVPRRTPSRPSGPESSRTSGVRAIAEGSPRSGNAGVPPGRADGLVGVSARTTRQPARSRAGRPASATRRQTPSSDPACHCSSSSAGPTALVGRQRRVVRVECAPCRIDPDPRKPLPKNRVLEPHREERQRVGELPAAVTTSGGTSTVWSRMWPRSGTLIAIDSALISTVAGMVIRTGPLSHGLRGERGISTRRARRAWPCRCRCRPRCRTAAPTGAPG